MQYPISNDSLTQAKRLQIKIPFKDFNDWFFDIYKCRLDILN